MELVIKHTGSTTSVYDKNKEVCKFVTGSRSNNLKYAKLIAAAPDLLEALKGCMDELEKYNKQHISSGDQSAAYKIGQIVIEKATKL